MDLNNKILSIIVPVYNVEQYISACLDSLYKQGVDEGLYEVVVVNDGTPDRSMNIVNQYASEHTNIKIIQQENGGVSVARNNGIKHAAGKYITFLDADDEIYPGILENVFEFLEINVPDVLVMRSIKHYIKDVVQECYRWDHLFSSGEYGTGLEIFSRGYTRSSVCGGVYLRDFIVQNQIRFPAGIKNGEDAIFYCLCDLCSAKTQFFDMNFYMVKERVNSASTTFSKRRLEETTASLDYIKKLLLDERFQGETGQKRLYHRLYGFLSMLIYNTVCTRNVDYNFLSEELQMGKYLPIRYIPSWKVWILNAFPYCFYLSSVVKYQILAKWFRVL
ncbi:MULTISPECIES: glycosyltransferase [Butyricimonas]|uniref:glycosyltransferase n=1 Tax=Butyricimonas TaxID=574697 RepID=UPI00208AD1B3|nr:glycosyltransferase [Butyricimonas paravirosa]BDF56171.1 glycosyl transferase [Odoribacteraceae bacterium]GKH95036.1 glycosyl transferase [Odoribacteraceae bacterium]GKH97659.1 glycosyl transferase [Odoribacteraceae bacterium]GKI01546.1 glycosyl transferase [Odoribacteraceae bacterium]